MLNVSIILLLFMSWHVHKDMKAPIKKKTHRKYHFYIDVNYGMKQATYDIDVIPTRI